MSPKEKVTYFVYNEGVDPNILRLGTLVFDYANPRTTRKAYRHGEISDLFDDPPKATQDHRDPECSIFWSQNSGVMFDIGLRKIVEGGHSYTKSNTRLIVGKSGSKIEIIDQDKFFEDLLKDTKVQTWFETRLSVAKNMSTLRAKMSNIVSAPKIWLLTGVYTMQDGQSFSIRTQETSTKATGNAPVTDATGLSSLLGVKVGVSVHIGNGIHAISSAPINGRKVWAAQWIRVKAKYVPAKDLKNNKNAIVNQLQLLDEWSVGTERGDDEEPPTVELELETEAIESEDEEIPEWNEEQWQEFDKRVDGLLQDLGE